LPLLEPLPSLVPPPFVADLVVRENSYATRDAYRGDTPMMNRWKTLGLPTVLAAAFFTPAARPAEPAAEPDKTSVILKQLAELRTAIESLDRTVKREVGDLRTDIDRTDVRLKAAQVDMEKLRSEVAQLRAEMESLRKLYPTTQVSAYPPEARTEMEQMRRTMEQIRQDLDAMRRQPPASRISNFPPAGDLARVRLVNTFLTPMTIVVNGRAYQLEPGDTRLTDPIPYGTFTYEVLGVQAPRVRTFTPGEPFTITVHPR
jgi:hypothetical protein